MSATRKGLLAVLVLAVPLPAEGRYAEAFHALERADPRAALEALDPGSTPLEGREALLEGVAYYRLQRGAAALAAFQRAARAADAEVRRRGRLDAARVHFDGARSLVEGKVPDTGATDPAAELHAARSRLLEILAENPEDAAAAASLEAVAQELRRLRAAAGDAAAAGRSAASSSSGAAVSGSPGRDSGSSAGQTPPGPSGSLVVEREVLDPGARARIQARLAALLEQRDARDRAAARAAAAGAGSRDW